MCAAMGSVQEVYWDGAGIQGALLDELVLHLEITFVMNITSSQCKDRLTVVWVYQV